MTFGVDDGQIGLACLLELLHDEAHGVGRGKGGWWRKHELADGKTLIELGAEHDMANVRDVDVADERASRIGYGNE